MARKFQVSVDITMSRTLFVDAENEEQARIKVGNWIGDDPCYYVKDGAYVSHEITDVDETEENIDDNEE